MGMNIELTRRCNMACKHCLRGDAQNLTISKEIIDKIFTDTAKIIRKQTIIGCSLKLQNNNGLNPIIVAVKYPPQGNTQKRGIHHRKNQSNRQHHGRR